MIKTITDFYESARRAIEIINQFIRQYSLLGIFELDHLGYKCSSSPHFEEMRRLLEPEHRWLYQSFISGRRISIIRMQQQLPTMAGPLSLIELSDHKPNTDKRDGFDHVELYPVTVNYDLLVVTLRKRGLAVEEVVRPHHTTYDITLENGFKIRLTRERLAEKIKREMK